MNERDRKAHAYRPLVWERFDDGLGEYGFISRDPDSPAEHPRYYYSIWNDIETFDLPPSEHRFLVRRTDLNRGDEDMDIDIGENLLLAEAIRLAEEDAVRFGRLIAAGISGA
jgi:hypothetical protein